VTESRVLSASDFMSTLIRLSLSWTIGFIGLFSMLKGAKSEVHSAHVRKGHTGSDEHQAHKLLAEAGPHGPWYWFGVRTSRRDRWSRRRRPRMRQLAGMARSQSFLPPLSPVPLKTGCVRLSANPRAQRARRAAWRWR
jgi:hypothetical protein